MPAWVKCERCKKVKPGSDFEDGSGVCQACLTSPVRVDKPPAKARASAVTTRRAAAPAAPAAPSGPRAPLLGVAGSGDLEVRERRARRKALDQLAETHAEDFEHLLHAARRDEGLRA
jgi:hypothetical protein